LHFVFLFPLVFLVLLAQIARPWRLLLASILTITFLFVGWRLIDRAPHRGMRQFLLVNRRRRSPLVVYTGRPVFIWAKPNRFFRTVGPEEPILLLGERFRYPFYYPAFKRKVFLASLYGPSIHVLGHGGVSPEIAEACLRRYRESLMRRSAFEPMTPADMMSELPDPLAYCEAIAQKHGIRYLFSAYGPINAFDRSPKWRLLYAETRRSVHGRKMKPNGHRVTALELMRNRMALYEYTGEGSAARDRARPN